MQTLFLSFSRQNIGTAVEMGGGAGGESSMFPFFDTLPANLELRPTSRFEYLQHESIARLWWKT